MTCRRSLEYVAALAAIATALGLIAFAISVTHINNRNQNRLQKQNNNATTITSTAAPTDDELNKKPSENYSETQLLIGTTTTKDLIYSTVKPTSTSSSSASTTLSTSISTTTSTTTSIPSLPSSDESVHIVLPTIKSVVTAVTSNNIYLDDHYDGEFSTTTLSSAIDPSTIEVNVDLFECNLCICMLFIHARILSDVNYVGFRTGLSDF